MEKINTSSQSYLRNKNEKDYSNKKHDIKSSSAFCI